MTYGEITTAIITSLIASVVFWVVFNVIPEKIERRRIKPLVDFDLYHILTNLGFFLELPFRPSQTRTSFIQQRLYNGQIEKKDFELYLSTKCLTEEYHKVDDTAKNLLPIGEKLDSISKEILDTIQKLYVFNKYLSYDLILLCKQISDKLTTHDFKMHAFTKEGNYIFGPVNPTMRGEASMFWDVYQLYLRLQDYLINQKPMRNELGDFYDYFTFRGITLNYARGQYKEIIKHSKRRKKKSIIYGYYFKSLYRVGKKDEALNTLKEFLTTDKERLIYHRGLLDDIIEEKCIIDTLISERSEAEYQEMIDCLKKEQKYKKQYEEFAKQLQTYYKHKENT